jgi:hypothetical protein
MRDLPLQPIIALYERETAPGARERAGFLRRYELVWTFLAMVLLTAAIIWWRRPEQVTHPYIWDEELTFIDSWLHRGWLGVFNPVNDELIFSSSFLGILSLQLTFLHFARATATFAILFTAGIATAIALSPTYLRWRGLCALATLLIPTNAEVFGVLLYSFWWAILLLFLVILWEDSRRLPALRWAFLIIGGLSSALVAPTAIILGMRAAIERSRAAIVIAGGAAALSLVQIYVYATSSRLQKQNVRALFAMDTFWSVIRKYLGGFWAYRLPTAPYYKEQMAVAGILLIAAITIPVFMLRQHSDRRGAYLLWSICGIALATSIARVDPRITDPWLAGPRYYFLPYVTIAWTLIYLAATSAPVIRTAMIVILAVALLNGPGNAAWTSHHDVIDWTGQVWTCLHAPSEYWMPVHFAGSRAVMWGLALTPNECQELVSRSMFDRFVPIGMTSP